MKALAIGLLTLCWIATSEARIGATLGMSQREYGYPGTSTAWGSVEWHVIGWTIFESYDSEGYCNQVIYDSGGIYSDATILGLLRENTPRGVTWTNDGKSVFNQAAGLGSTWHSTQYTNNGIVTESLVASFDLSAFRTADGRMGSPSVTEIPVAHFRFIIRTVSKPAVAAFSFSRAGPDPHRFRCTIEGSKQAIW